MKPSSYKSKAKAPKKPIKHKGSIVAKLPKEGPGPDGTGVQSGSKPPATIRKGTEQLG